MKTKLLNLLIAMIFFVGTMILSSCAKYPKPGFIYYAYTSPANAGKVDFTNTSNDSQSYLWDFGDGTTSTEKDPSHKFAENKTYTVKLTANDSKSSGDRTESITISTHITYASITNLKATIPDKNAGNNDWDTTGVGNSNSNPDVYFVIKNDTNTLYTQTNPDMNASIYSSDTIVTKKWVYYYSNVLVTTYGLAINKADFTTPLTLEIWDEDGTTDELIGTIPLNISSYITGTATYPYDIFLTANGINWTVEIEWH